MGLVWSMPETKGSPASPAENGAMTSFGVQLPDSQNKLYISHRKQGHSNAPDAPPIILPAM